MTDNSRRLWEAVHYTEHPLNNVKFRVHSAVSFRLGIDRQASRTWRSCQRSMVTMPDGALADRDSSKVIRNAVYGYQHNDVFDCDLKYLDRQDRRHGCAGERWRSFSDWPCSPSTRACFKKSAAALPQAMQRHARQQGLVVFRCRPAFQLLERKNRSPRPESAQGTGGKSTVGLPAHYLGIVCFRRVAAICPALDAGEAETVPESTSRTCRADQI